MRITRENLLTDEKSSADFDALVAALTPIAELCLKSGNGAGDLVMAAKVACIAAAATNAQIGSRLNHSRISAATGLTRKEIRMLSAAVSMKAAGSVKQSAGQRTSRVVHGWKTDPAFQNDRGEPSALTVRGEGATFPDLVRRYGGDVTPVSVLKELQRTGVVSRAKLNTVRLLKKNLRSPGLTKESLTSFGDQIRSIGNTILANIENPDAAGYVAFEPLFELTTEETALFHTIFSERAAALIDGVQRWYEGQVRMKKRAPRPAKDRKIKAGIGVYLLNEES